MSRFNLNDNHPLIPNSNQYYFEKKYVSIHSEDRDVLKYRNPSSFELYKYNFPTFKVNGVRSLYLFFCAFLYISVINYSVKIKNFFCG